jgi:hypothetical protein
MTICNSVNIPTYPTGGNCVSEDSNGRRLYHNTGTTNDIQQRHLDRFEAEFNRLMGVTPSASGDMSNHYEKHQKINCLLSGLLDNIQNNYSNFNEDLQQLESQLNNEKKHVDEQEKVLKTNEDSDLVTKYRNESSDKRNKQMNTQFTIYVTMIVVFLIVQGIVFFV